jgi:hypothetical protein
MKKEKELNRDENQIYDLLIALGLHALADIEFMALHKKPIGGFILACCFIDQISAYRYNKLSDHSFQKFIDEYLPAYKDLKLQTRLRHMLTHNYSVAKELVVGSNIPHLHMKPLGISTMLNLEDFAKDLRDAFEIYKREIHNSGEVRENAFKWSQRHKIIKMTTIS